MNKAQQEELDRINELKAKIWSRTIINLMRDNKNPFEITKDEIESNKGRIEKALRLLDSYVTFNREEVVKSNSYSRTIKEIYTVDMLDESIDFGTAPIFDISVTFLHDQIFKNELNSKSDMDNIGYRSIDSLSPTEIIYVYWHQEEYSILKTKTTFTRIDVLPKALLDIRTKTMLRAIIDQYYHNHFHSRLEKYLDLPEGSIKTTDHFDISIRNFAAHGYRFSMEAYYGTGGFQQEYQHFHDYFEALLKNLKKFGEIIEKAGGHAEIVKSYRKEIIEHLLITSPLHAFQPIKDDTDIPWNLRKDDIEKAFDNPYFNSFILTHAQFFEYDTLYGEDTSILVIDAYNSCKNFKETTFSPEADEFYMIEGSK